LHFFALSPIIDPLPPEAPAMTATGFDYGELLKRWFAPGDEYPGVFVLGCYARYVTLFSQQIER
jgi:hypothetical protein